MYAVNKNSSDESLVLVDRHMALFSIRYGFIPAYVSKCSNQPLGERVLDLETGLCVKPITHRKLYPICIFSHANKLMTFYHLMTTNWVRVLNLKSCIMGLYQNCSYHCVIIAACKTLKSMMPCTICKHMIMNYVFAAGITIMIWIYQYTPLVIFCHQVPPHLPSTQAET